MPRLFGEKLRYLRQQQAMTQAALARHLPPVSRGHINNIETGRKEPSLDLALKAALLFQVSVDYLLRDELPVDQPQSFSLASTATPASPETRYNLGSKLRRLRVGLGKTQVELAQELGLQTQSHISLLENGQSDVSLDLILRLAAVFGVTTDYLIRDSVPLNDNNRG